MKAWQANKKNIERKKRIKLRVMEQSGGICCLCGRRTDPNSEALFPTMDHVLPRSEGGKYTFDNLLLACRECNTRKGNESWIKHARCMR